MAEDNDIYVVDSSSWLQIEGHPETNRILDALGSMLERGQLKAPPEVFNELKEVNSVEGWLKLHISDIRENRSNDTDYLLKVGEVTHRFPAMAGARTSKNKADPYVIALAACGSPNPGKWIVVCNETLTRRPNRKMPTACKAFGVECMGIIDMLRREFPEDGW